MAFILLVAVFAMRSSQGGDVPMNPYAGHCLAFKDGEHEIWMPFKPAIPGLDPPLCWTY